MFGSELNLLSAALGFGMTAVFIAFVCARFLCCRAPAADDGGAQPPLDFDADFPADLSRQMEHAHCGLEPWVIAAIPTMKYNFEAFHSKDDTQSWTYTSLVMQSDHDRGQAMFLGDGNVIPVDVAAPGLVVMGCGPGGLGLGLVLVLEMIKEAAALGGGYRKENELNCSFSRLSSSRFSSSGPIATTIIQGEYNEKEILRIIPTCRHNFHLICLDVWLRKHTTCPMCRVSLKELPDGKADVIPARGIPQSPALPAVNPTPEWFLPTHRVHGGQQNSSGTQETVEMVIEIRQ